MTQLMKYEAARQALDAAIMFDDVIAIKNVAKQAETYARLAKDNTLIEKATEIRVRAERKAGGMLSEALDRGERMPVNGVNQYMRESHAGIPTLAEIGVTAKESSRWQQLASMTEEHFETAVATAKDTAGQVTTAFMLREAKAGKPHGKPKTGAKADAMRDDLKAAAERGVSMLMTYAGLTLRALRSQDSVSVEEASLLCELADAIAAMTAQGSETDEN